ncbi:MAG: glycosyl hydrolase [Acidithiobacillus sp.]|nr:glycosyl hydrolase [Acidithiobacillus sp.]
MNAKNHWAPKATSPHPTWATAQKSLVGTALGPSRVWFTLGKGIVTEVFYPRIDIPAIRDLGFLIGDGKGFWLELKNFSDWTQSLADPRVPLPQMEHRHDRFTFSFLVVIDPLRDVMLVDYQLDAASELQVYVLCAARLGGDPTANQGYVGSWEGRELLWAEQGPFGLALLCRDPDGKPAFGQRSVGEIGASDLWQDFSRHGRMTWEYQQAGPGEVALGGAIPPQGTLALGLGTSKEAAATNGWASLCQGFPEIAENYRTDWLHWHETHQRPAAFARKFSQPVQDLYQRSKNVLKIHSDKTFPGAIVASLSVPWGESSNSRGGYHLVWSRDLVESAGAALAAGMVQEARQVLCYLISTQQADGHWLQNQWLGGKPFWQGIQLDEAAFPVLLAAMLRAHKALGGIAIEDMVTRALGFILREGPVTGQDRWEEDAGVNTFTLAVAIAALVEGAEILGGKAAECALLVADYWNARLEDWTFVRDTELAQQLGVTGYYLRVAPEEVLIQDGAQDQWVMIKNRAHDPHLPANEQISTDFLQLVRYGLRRADDPRIVDAVKVMDALLKTDTPSGPVWHRYNGDGYGEKRDGSPFDGTGIGRGWPLLVGERGHYALALGEDPRSYLQAMATMTGKGGLLPEQVWDSEPIPKLGLFPGKPSGSAMPLVWAHGEFLKLCHSALAQEPIDRPASTWARYQGQRPKLSYRLWRLRQRPRTLIQGQELKILLTEPFVVHWGINDWQEVQDTPSEDWELGHVASLPTQKLPAGTRISFTLFWQREQRWMGEDFQVEIMEKSNDHD